MSVSSSFKSSWNLIRREWDSLSSERTNPLFGLDTWLEFNELPADHRSIAPPPPAPLPAKLRFSLVDNSVLMELRRRLYVADLGDETARWCGKILRFCELKLSSLQSRLLDRCEERKQARQVLLHLGLTLGWAAHAFGDLRYLNAALKIADLPWVPKLQTLEALINQKPKKEEHALAFHFLIAVETQMEMLERRRRSCRER